MRTCLGEAARMVADDLSVQDFNGAKWLLLSGYCFYGEHLLQRAIELAAEANIKVALDLASFEIVQSFKQELKDVLESGRVHCCFCNEVCFVGLLVTCCLLQLKDVFMIQLLGCTGLLPCQAAFPATKPTVHVKCVMAMHQPAWYFLVALLHADMHDRTC